MRKIEPKQYGPMEVERAREEYPTLHLDLKHIPEAKDWKIGEKYQITLDIQMASLDIRNEKQGNGEGYAGFDITGIGINEKKKVARYKKMKEDEDDD